MDLDARPYRAFVRIAELGSFGRAAESLAVSQPALSATIRELERRLGFALFRRHNRRVSLTPEGRFFLDRARRLIMETDWINQSARDIRENRLRIGVAHHSGAIPERRAVIERFMAARPDIPLGVVARTHAQLLGDLRSGEIDVAITIEASDADAISVVEPADRGVDRRTIAARTLRLALPRGHGLCGAPLDTGALGGVEISTIGRAHGVALSEHVARRIVAAGGVVRHLPEGDGPSVLRYAAVLGLAAVDLGWFGAPPESMVSRDAAALDVHTRLVMLTAAGERREGASAFLEFVDPSR